MSPRCWKSLREETRRIPTILYKVHHNTVQSHIMVTRPQLLLLSVTLLELSCHGLSLTNLSPARHHGAVSTTTTTLGVALSSSESVGPTTIDNSDESTLLSHSPLSLTFDELTESLGARAGRARAVWDCYSMGMDPVLFYDPSIPESELDRSVWEHLEDSKGDGHDGDNDDDESHKKWTRDELKNLIVPKRRNQGLGVPALQALSALFGGGDDSVQSEDPKEISKGLSIEESIATISHISRAKDGTTKLLVELRQDGLEVETVIIPWHETGRSTLCVSSQVGCRQGCSFCATGRMGRLRNLSADEIVAQVFLSRKVCRTLNILPVDGVVFMGMGDAADNVDNVLRASEVLTGSDQFKMAQRKVSISTVGPDPESFAKLGSAPAVLAWSVHSSRDDLRKKLVPTTKYPMIELRNAYLQALLERPMKLRTTMLELALISKVNDHVEDADHLANFVLEMYDQVPGIKVMVNLIPFNDIGHAVYKKPPMERVWAFQERLTSKGLKCFIRTTRGDDESAACGQLATKKRKKQPTP